MNINIHIYSISSQNTVVRYSITLKESEINNGKGEKALRINIR